MASSKKKQEKKPRTPKPATRKRPVSSRSKPRRDPKRARAKARRPKTLAVDIGGTGIKMIVLDHEGNAITPRARMLTPQPANPESVLGVIREMTAEQPEFDRVSVGFPGVVSHGVVRTAPNLDDRAWRGHAFELELHELLGKPVRVVNDADLQGYGVIQGQGMEMVLTLGTGMGAALFTGGHLVPNLELGHHPFKKGRTYEQRICDAELIRLGKKRWSKRVAEVVAQLQPIFNFDVLYIGGGNARRLRIELPENVQLFSNVEGLTGGIKLWQDV